MTNQKFMELANFIWAVADLLRGPYRPPQYERVMLPMTVLRRFDCLLADTKEKVLKEYDKRKGGKIKDDALDGYLNKITGERFHNRSPLDFQKLKGDPDNIHQNLPKYISGFSTNVRRIFEYFDFDAEIEKMHDANILYMVVAKFADMDLHPDIVKPAEMGLVFEDLIRRFNEQANETAGDHFTPREVIRLMVELLFADDDDLLSVPGTIRKMLDPACGTGGMLAEAQNYLREHNYIQEDNSGAKLYAYGQDYNKRSFAVAASDMLIKRIDHNGTGEGIRFGDSLINDPQKGDQFPGEKFDYLLANPPFGVDWKKQAPQIQKEHHEQGFSGRYGPGLPRVNDGALLFLLHMISKFQDVNPKEKLTGSRCAIVLNGSPLFTGGAGSGESNIRRWIIEQDMLEAIIALPEQMFYNTGIGTYVWIVTNRKDTSRTGKIQLVDARERWAPMKRSLGNKRRYLTDDIITEVVREYGTFQPTETSKLFDNEDFGYRRVRIERPLRLRFELTAQAREAFLDQCPEFLDAVLAMEQEIGTEPLDDWNEAWEAAQRVTDEHNVKWTKPKERLFRQCFGTVDPEAKPVIGKRAKFELPTNIGDKPRDMTEADFASLFGITEGKPNGKTRRESIEYEPDPALRDFENIPLKENVVEFFLREVRPFVPDAWINHEERDHKDECIGKVGYEINFNREFFKYTPPRKLEDIDRELKDVEARIMAMLSEGEK